MSTKINLTAVSSSKDLRQFIDFQYKLYDGDPFFAAEPFMSQKKLLSKKNPFFDNNHADLFMIKKGDKIVGRIAFILNRTHNQSHNQNIGFFGFFEVIEDYSVAKALLDKVVKLAQSNGLTGILGPTNLTTNDTCGILTSGFNASPIIMMPYSKPYYKEFMIQYGFKELMVLNSYQMFSHDLKKFYEKPVVQKIKHRISSKNITIRKIDYKDYKNEIKLLCDIYNESNKDNWGFVPLSLKEFIFMADDMKTIIPENLILFAVTNNKPIGFVVAMPDYNIAFKHLNKGRLLPFGIFKFLWYKRKIDKARILILGVSSKYKKTGIDLLLYEQINKQLNNNGFIQAEACYVMDNNIPMNSIIKKMGGNKTKTYSLYNYQLT